MQEIDKKLQQPSILILNQMKNSSYQNKMPPTTRFLKPSFPCAFRWCHTCRDGGSLYKNESELFSFLSQIKERGYVIATTQALSFSFFLPFSTTLVCECSTVLLEFPNHPQEFPNHTGVKDLLRRRSLCVSLDFVHSL